MYHSAARFGADIGGRAGSRRGPPTVRVILRAIYFDDRSNKVSARAQASTPFGAIMRRLGDSHLPNGVCAGILAAGLGHGNGRGFCLLRVVFPLANLDSTGALPARFCLFAEPLRPWPGFAGASSSNVTARSETAPAEAALAHSGVGPRPCGWRSVSFRFCLTQR